MINPAAFNSIISTLEDLTNMEWKLPEEAKEAIKTAFANEIALATELDNYLDYLKRF